jgi:hypothetical protein
VEAEAGELSLSALPGADLVEQGIADLAYFDAIEPRLYRFPAIDPGSFRRRVEDCFTV